MTTNSSDSNIRDPQGHVAYVFRKLSRVLTEVRTRSNPEQVHQLRTTLRRIKVLAASLGTSEEKNVARLQKPLDRIFARAGKLRDLDVQIEALETLTLPSVENDKSQLLVILQRQREKRTRKLVDAIQKAQGNGFPKRQRKAKAVLVEAASRQTPGISVLSATRLELTPFLDKIRSNHFTEETLHNLRLEVKELRYSAEAAGPAGVRIANALKPLQTAIGEWHDWQNLCTLAEKKLTHPAGHPILPVLRTKVSAHFARAQQAIRDVHNVLSNLASPAAAPRLQQGKVETIHAVAAQAS